MVDGVSEADVDSRSALKGMISFFTVWHMDITQRDMDSMERKFHLVPVVGLIFGVLLLIEMGILVESGFGSGLFVAVAALATVYIGSKFIHFDGLTDFGDGMIVSGQQEDHVRALKDTLVGAGGMGVALITVLASVSLYSMCGNVWVLFIPPVTEVFVKNAMVAAAAYGKAGNGMAGRQVAMTTRDSAIKSLAVSAVCATVVLLLGLAVQSLIFESTILGLMFEPIDILFVLAIGLAVSYATGYLMARCANSNFGMVNGDILGATNEISRVTVLLALLIYAFMVV